MNISAPFIRRPVMTTFVMVAILISGWMAFQWLPVSDLPTIDHPKITVTAGYTGASPEVILQLVTIPLEKELTHVKGVQTIDSKSSPGFSSITLTFDLSKNMDEAIQDVQTAINRSEAHLPADIQQRPTYHRKEASQEHIMYMLLTSDNGNIGEMRTYADAYIIPRLTRIEGIAQVQAFGPEKSIWLRLNPDLMAARHIGFNQVIDAVKKKTAQTPLGSIQTGSKMLTIELTGALQQAKDLEMITIGDSDVRLRDIADISENATNAPKFFFVTPESSSPTLILGIQKISDSNTVAISTQVQEVLAKLEKELPASIHLNLWFDKAVWIKESIHDVEWSLLFAFVLVVLVIYLSLGKISEALIPSMALPMSLLGTFCVMYLCNYSLDLLSLLALTLSVGFVVDDAIVVLENIVRHKEGGESALGVAVLAKTPEMAERGVLARTAALNASLSGSKQICFTIVSMTLSLVAVFIPLLFMAGLNGRLFREFSVTLAVSILVSGFISLTLTPMLCSRFLPANSEKTALQLASNRANSWMTGIYSSSLQWCFRHPKTILAVALGCVLVTVPLFTRLPVNLIPAEDRGFLITPINLPSGASSEEITAYQEKLDALIRKHPAVENFLDINLNNNLIFVIRLLPLKERAPQNAVIAELQQEFNAIPGIQAFTHGYQLINLDLDISSGGQYKMLISGPEQKDVDAAAQNIAAALQAHPDFTFAQSSQTNDSPKLSVTLNEELAHQYGFNKRQVQDLLQHAYGQNSVGSIQKWGMDQRIYMELLPHFQDHAGALAKLHLSSPEGTLVPLKSFVTWEEKLGSPDLIREEQLPATKLKFSFAEHVAPNKGLELVQEIANGMLPPNVSATLKGSAKGISSMISNTLMLLLAAAVVMYIVLGILYESFIHPLTILSALPFAGLGGVLTLYLFGEPISIFSAVGFLLLIGIVKKNGIMMVDYALEKQKAGMAPEQAIHEGCLKRFRPIMMTTVAAIMGAIPIAIGFGDGAEMRKGLGLVIVGGLLFSQVLTLYVTPILYLTFDKLRRAQR